MYDYVHVKINIEKKYLYVYIYVYIYIFQQVIHNQKYIYIIYISDYVKPVENYCQSTQINDINDIVIFYLNNLDQSHYFLIANVFYNHKILNIIGSLFSK